MDIQITQDIRKYKPKDLGPFSLKEIGFIIIAAGVGYAAHKFLHTEATTSIAFAFPILVVGFLKPFGLSFIQFARTIIKEEFFSPREYYNETDFEYDPNKFEEVIGEEVSIPSNYNEKDVGLEFKRSKEDLKNMIC